MEILENAGTQSRMEAPHEGLHSSRKRLQVFWGSIIGLVLKNRTICLSQHIPFSMLLTVMRPQLPDACKVDFEF